jgi:hypothetical protein
MTLTSNQLPQHLISKIFTYHNTLPDDLNYDIKNFKFTKKILYLDDNTWDRNILLRNSTNTILITSGSGLLRFVGLEHII